MQDIQKYNPFPAFQPGQAEAIHEIQEKIKPDDNRCGIDVRNQVEPGFICEKWTYDGNGYQEE